AFSPRILALDKDPSFANTFNDALAPYLPGYRLMITDDQTPGVLRYIYKTGGNATLRLEYRYKADPEVGKTTPKVYYQSISGEAPVITDIYNYLFGSGLTPDKLPLAVAAGLELSYEGNRFKFVLQPDEYAPGYWSMTFL